MLCSYSGKATFYEQLGAAGSCGQYHAVSPSGLSEMIGVHTRILTKLSAYEGF